MLLNIILLPLPVVSYTFSYANLWILNATNWRIGASNKQVLISRVQRLGNRTFNRRLTGNLVSFVIFKRYMANCQNASASEFIIATGKVQFYLNYLQRSRTMHVYDKSRQHLTLLPA
jgi:hypothetical protein